MLEYRFQWEKTIEGNARLLGVYGTTAELVLPETIAGLPLAEVGPYCFAESIRLPKQYEEIYYRADEEHGWRGLEAMQDEEEYRVSRNGVLGAEEENHASGSGVLGAEEENRASGSGVLGAERENGVSESSLRRVGGKFLESIDLPDSLKKIGNLAFYNCTGLKKITLGKGFGELGSDAFMNCRSLHLLEVRGNAGDKSGIRVILHQVSADMEVHFLGTDHLDEGEAKLLFPEYYESYDEIAPAHLFGRNIEGEGFRARQCFKDGVMDFAQYDTIFPKACAEESEVTLCRLAMNRLRYPIQLQQAARERYETYVRMHTQEICLTAIRGRDEKQILFLCEKGLMQREGLEQCVRWAAEQEWAAGGAYFLRLKEQFFPQKSVASRYEFDEF